MQAFARNVLQFGRVLRRAGVDLSHTRLVEAVGALESIGLRHRGDVRATLCALLVHRREDVVVFELAFEAFFRSDHLAFPASAEDKESAPPGAVPQPTAGIAAIATAGDEVDDGAPSEIRGAYSATAGLRTKDFAAFTADELDHARRVLSRLPWRLPLRRTKRWKRSRGGAIDLRATLRTPLTRGDLIDLRFRRRRSTPRPLIVIADVSGSMERYSRVLLHFIFGLAQRTRHVESFVFSTTLTRITHRMVSGESAQQLTRLVGEVRDWGGGTRIGDALRQFNTRWARRVMRNGPVVVLVSDGWDRGDPAVLAAEVRRLQRRSRRLVWLNPLLGTSGYEPLTRGLQAALPYVDDFLPVHNIASLEDLAAHLHQLA